MSEVKLIIPRQPYGNLQRPGAGRIGDVRLSPEGMAALGRLTTCSRGAVLDLAVQVLDVVASGSGVSLQGMADDLVRIVGRNHRKLATHFMMLGNYMLDEP